MVLEQSIRSDPERSRRMTLIHHNLPKLCKDYNEFLCSKIKTMHIRQKQDKVRLNIFRIRVLTTIQRKHEVRRLTRIIRNQILGAFDLPEAKEQEC